MYELLIALGVFIRANVVFVTGILLFLNLTAFLLFAYDKSCAVNKKQRIPEILLILSALLFGATGAFFAMLIFRHKTKHVTFLLTVPPLAMLQIVLLALAAFS